MKHLHFALRSLCTLAGLAVFALAQAGTVTFSSSSTWTAPAGVTSVTAEAWGGGGAGGGQNLASDGGGGGGGGAYSKSTGIAVTPGNTYTVSVGSGGLGVVSGTGGTGGDSFFINAATLMAKGGVGGSPSTGAPPAGGLGGAAAAGVGTTKFSGGNGGRGRDNNTGRGGPGGSSAGTAANGTAGPDPWSTLTAAAAPAGGGIGGNGGDTGANGFAPASGRGGGGGGSGNGLVRTGGAGVGGTVTLTFVGLPTATTAAATSIAATSATLNGSVTSDSNASTTVTFDYGLTVAYGSSITATPSPVAAGATNAVSASLTGLACGTTYHFRAKGVNTSGTTNGADFALTTLVCSAPTVTTTAASALSANGATLNGTVNSNGASTTVSFEYGLTIAYGTNIAATPTPVSASDPTTSISAAITGLTCGQTYHYRAIGVNAFGTTNGGDLTFATSACPSLVEFNSTGGTTATNGLHFYLHDTTKIQVRRLNNSGQVYSSTVIPPNNSLDNGVFIRANGTTYGPSHTVTAFAPTAYNNFSITPASPANPSSSGVQQTATGTFGITAGPQATVLWKYTTPLDFLIAEVTLVIPAGYTVSAANPVRYYHVFDTFLGGSDNGCGFSLTSGSPSRLTVGTYQPTSGVCTSTTSLPTGINVVESFRERSGLPFSNYCASGWQSFFTNGSTNCSVLQPAVMSNTLSATFVDTGIGVELNFIAPGTYTFSYDFVIGSPNVPPYDHLEIRHDGSGTLCPETVTVLACTSTGVPCDPNDIVNTGTLTGTLTTTPSPPVITQTPSTGISLGASASTQSILLQSSTSGTITLGTSGLSTTPTNGTKCWNTTTSTQSCSLTFANTPCVSGYECQETGTTYNNPPTSTNRNPLYTKLSSANFQFDVIALQSSGAAATSYTAASGVSVELFDDTTTPASCNAYTGAVATQAITFAASDNGRKATGNFNLSNAYSKLRCRVTDTNPTTPVYGCSSDTFSVRPSAATLVTSATATAPSAASTPTIKAGANFNLRATTSSGTNYAGSLARDATKLTAQITTQDSTEDHNGVVGTLSPATLTGNAVAVNATYSEVGHLYLAPGAYRDDSFTATDQPASCATTSTCDCVTDTTGDANLSDVLSSGKYGCSIGNKTAMSMGRFIPDHFAVVSPVLTQGCSAGATGYTYMAQPFSLTASIEAQTTTNAKTQNYSGVFARGVVGTQAENNNNGVPLASRLTFTAPWVSGAAAYSATLFSRPATTSWDATWGPFDALAVGAVVTSTVASVTANNDLDGVRLIDRNMDESNTSCTADTATTSDGTCPAVTLASGARMRYGRARLQNAYGSELLDLPVVFRAEYSVPTNGWVLNTLDSCSTVTLSFAPVTTPDITGNTCVLEPGNNSGKGCAAALTASQTNRRFLEGGVAGTDSNGVAGFAGNFNLWLKASGATHSGSIDIIASSIDSWLQYNWTGAIGNPRARATFGVFKSPLIYRRENY